MTATHPPYVKIWGILVVFTFLSFALAKLTDPLIVTLCIFAIATIKSSLVARYFMHLKIEPKFVFLIFFTGVAVVLIIMIGLIPDIVYQFGRMKS